MVTRGTTVSRVPINLIRGATHAAPFHFDHPTDNQSFANLVNDYDPGCAVTAKSPIISYQMHPKALTYQVEGYQNGKL